MRHVHFALISLGCALLTSVSHAQEIQPHITLSLEVAGEATINAVTYQCGSKTLAVSYVNAGPNLLAILPVEEQSTLFTSAIAASGARYTAGPYEWWTKGNEASLRNLMAEEDAKPLLECSVANQPQ